MQEYRSTDSIRVAATIRFGVTVVHPVHPAAWSAEKLAKAVQVRFRRDRGPGGQNRNKVETGVIVTFTPLGIQASATERRTQAENRRVALFRLRLQLALQHRSESTEMLPSGIWCDRLRGKEIQVNPSHQDFPALLAEALDVIAGSGWNIPLAAERLRVSNSQLTRLVKSHPPALVKLNQELEDRGFSPRR
jgi:hypothetical protein